ncbi:hypothetical protein [Nocardia kruczakiae]|uniref:hypothetical protein n=1 Tax=Nocardia kruczakiae TaxID=261477 RepID=UPI0012ED23E1|nr:hypothetical protein [Nocardia kruczakiae]
MFAGDRDQNTEADIRLVRPRPFASSSSGFGEAHRDPLRILRWTAFAISRMEIASGAAQHDSSGHVEMPVDGELGDGADDGRWTGPGEDGPEAVECDGVFAVAGEDAGDFGGDFGPDGVAVFGGAPIGLAEGGKDCSVRSEGGIEGPEANLTAGVLENFELGDCADGGPMVGGKRQAQQVDEPSRWMAQVDEQSDHAWTWNQRDHSGHVVADRIKTARGVEFLFELGVGFDHRRSITTIASSGCQWSELGGRAIATVVGSALRRWGSGVKGLSSIE